MDNKYTILRIWQQTAFKLKILAAMQRESMLAIVDRLVTAECERINLVITPEEDTSKDE